MAEGEKFNWWLTGIWWFILFTGVMCLMLVFATRKTIVIADSTDGQQTVGGYYAERKTLMRKQADGEAGVFWIPLEKGTKAGNVVVENSYLDRELHIFVGGAQGQFYAACAVEGDVTAIVTADSQVRQSGVLLRLCMDGVYEFQTSMDGENLKIQMSRPKENYQAVVVVDPGTGSDGMNAEEKADAEELTLAVSRMLAKQWNMEQVKLYITRTEEKMLEDEQQLAFVEDVEADFYIRLWVTQDENPNLYGICGQYNGAYFIPGFGNVKLADCLTKNVTITSGNRAVGLVEASQDSILYSLQIPGACIGLGYITNEKESALMKQEEYRQKLAAGVVAAVREVYTEYYEKEVQ